MTEPRISGKWARLTAPAYHHPNPRMLAEVAAGLSAPQKELSPKYFYDHRGSELFEEITRLPEYYPTRTERAILAAWMPALIPELGTRALVELGAGSAEKSRIIISAMQAAGTAEPLRADRRQRQLPEPDRRAASSGVSRPGGRACGRRHRRGASSGRGD